MTDSEQPLFFGGLPPRSAVAVAPTPVAAKSARTKRPRSAKRPVRAVQRSRWNTLAIVSIAVSLAVSLAGIICGVLALRQIRRSGQRGARLAIAGMLLGGMALAVEVAMLAILMVGGPNLAAGLIGLKPQPASSSSVFTTPPPVSAHEAAQAKAAITSGGGAIPGHIVSAQLCAAVKNFTALSNGAPSSLSVSPQVLAAMEALAAVDSPNRLIYEAFVAMVKNPTSVPSITKAQAVASDFAKAVQVDVATCL